VPSHVAEAAEVIAKEHKIRSAQDYLRSLMWDRKERLNSWLAVYMGATDSLFVRMVAARWMTFAVARMMKPGSKRIKSYSSKGSRYRQVFRPLNSRRQVVHRPYKRSRQQGLPA
jgi:hypothetical protein